jgi:hypothetical protein
MGIARDGDHPGRGAGGKAVEQGGRQREVPEVVDPERQLKAIPGDAALAAHTRIVDQYVQRFPKRQELLGAPAHRRQVGQVKRQERDRIVPGGRHDIRDRSAAFSCERQAA